MAAPKYNRDIRELRENAALWWPEELKDKNAQANILPQLLKTQNRFLSLLILSQHEPFQIFDLIRAAKFPANLFLKHLVVLSNYGGESIQRLGNEFTNIFPKENDKFYFNFIWKEYQFHYQFKVLPITGLGNKKLLIDGKGLTVETSLDDLSCDMIALLLFAAASEHADKAGLDACEIGVLLGNESQLNNFVKQRYITVSRIIGGATANSLGQEAQTEVVNFLRANLDETYVISRNATIYLKNYGKDTGMPFDIIVERGEKKVGIEVSFQVTTNSTIERKAGQAALRQHLMHDNGYAIAYVIDGAGNFQRSSAIGTICSYSDCTVAYTVAEFNILVDWIRSVL